MTGMTFDADNGITFPDSSSMGAIPRGWIDGLILSTAGSSATFGISAGQASDSTNARLMNLTSAYTKTTGAWSLGTAGGSLDTGTIANSTWYHVYLIRRSDTGVVDVLTSTSASAPTMPANYDQKRRIGAMKTDGSAQWLAFSQTGDNFLWKSAINEMSAVAGTTTTRALVGVPTGIKVGARVRGIVTNSSSGNQQFLFQSADETAAIAFAISGNATAAVINGGQSGYDITLLTNTSAQFYWSATSSDTTVYMVSYGWVDTRGRNA